LRVKDAIAFIIESAENVYGPGESESIAFIILDFIGFPRKKIMLNSDTEIDSTQEDFIRAAVKKLKKSQPVQYILGETEFFGLKFRLDKNVLIPRQETEELVYRIIREYKTKNPVVLDLGTGSGCIAVTIAKNIPSAKVYATDISPGALKIARENAALNEVIVTAIIDDMLRTRLEKNLKFDIIISNPPYVRDLEKQFMHPNVLNYEPASALFVRDDNPLVYYRAIAEIASDRLNNGGRVYVEINENFGSEVAGIFLSAGLQDTEVFRDIHGKDRFVKAMRRAERSGYSGSQSPAPGVL
jgi:release factor glutamine methyltransferase